MTKRGARPLKWVRNIGLALIAGFVALQFVRPARNDQPPGPDDLIVRHAPPAEVARLLEVSCYDCHSNRTRYPWYADVQPAGWMLARHVEDGKGQLNFSHFGAYPTRIQIQKLLAVADEVYAGSMPLESYHWLHRDAKLTLAQRQLLAEWAEALSDEIDERE